MLNMEKITDAIPKSKDMIKIGQYYIGRYKDTKHCIWIENTEGEGMAIPEVDFDRFLLGFWKKRF